MRELSRRAVAVRQVKVNLLRARRLLAWAREPTEWRVPAVEGARAFAHRVYAARIPLVRCDLGADPRLEAGKRTNLAIAAPHFDGRVLSADTPLSFWRVLGRPTAARGFALGAEVRAGCMVPTLGGGLCLLSNAIFAAACELGWTVLERHGHTMRPDTALNDEVPGLDATVFWPFVDLRVAPAAGRARLGVRIAGDVLELDVRADRAVAPSVVREEARSVAGGQLVNRIVRIGADGRRDVVARNRSRLLSASAERRNCLSCDEDDCHARPRELRDWA